LVGSREHGLPHHQQGLPSPPPQEVSSDVVFDETNGSPREQVVDLDDVDEEDVPTAALRTMAIGDVRPLEQKEQDQPSSSTMVHPPTQDDEQVHQKEA
jgi:hypothetical protein